MYAHTRYILTFINCFHFIALTRVSNNMFYKNTEALCCQKKISDLTMMHTYCVLERNANESHE